MDLCEEYPSPTCFLRTALARTVARELDFVVLAGEHPFCLYANLVFFQGLRRMFIGHYGVALGGKRIAPKTSLGMLLLAAQFVDLLWPIFLLLGLEHVRVAPGSMRANSLDFYDYPITHSLLTGVGWAAGVGLVYFALRRYARGAWVLAACVASHWFLDAIVHRPDLPFVPGGQLRVGLGLWNSLPATVAVEVGTLSLGLFFYLRATTPLDRTGRWALASFIMVILALWLGAILGPPPPTAKVVAFTGLGGWLFVLWGHWMDRHRKTIGTKL